MKPHIYLKSGYWRVKPSNAAWSACHEIWCNDLAAAFRAAHLLALFRKLRQRARG